jgi:hypothetical protein
MNLRLMATAMPNLASSHKIYPELASSLRVSPTFLSCLRTTHHPLQQKGGSMSVIRTVHIAVRLAAVATLVTFSGTKADVGLQGVAQANSKIAGLAVPNVLSPELTEVVVAQGSTPLENGKTTDFLFYGYNGDGPMLPAPGDVQTSTHNVEATKTEPDKNTYLVLAGQDGPDPQYHYGTHFLFQGHESGLGNHKKGYIYSYQPGC